MTQAIIFSKNRPMQLEALLRSMDKYASGFFDEIAVLYKHDPEYGYGYQRLKEIYTNINWTPETEFHRNVLDLLKDNGDYVAFFVDDMLLFKSIDRSLLAEFTPDVYKISLYLGENIVYCYPNDSWVSAPLHWVKGDYMKYALVDAGWEFNYKVSLDGDIFRTKQIKEIIGGVEARNPNELESVLQKANFPQPNILAYRQSRTVNIPHNRVNKFMENRFAGGDENELNSKFMAGRLIDFEEMQFEVNAHHQEIPFIFEYEPCFDLSIVPIKDGSLDQSYYRDLLKLPPNSKVVEIGAYLGGLTNYILTQFNPLSIKAFEPIKEYAEECRKRFEHSPNVEIIQKAVSHQAGTMTLYVNDLATSYNKHWATISGLKAPKREEVVETIRLSEFLGEPIDLLCINCEGGEYNILDDLLKTKTWELVSQILIQFHPTVPVETRGKTMQLLAEKFELVHGNACWGIWQRRN